MANYDANIRVSADTKQAESALTSLQKSLNKLSDFSLKLNSRDIGQQVNQLGQQLRGVGERGLLGGLTLAAGKATTSLGVFGAKLGIVGTVAAGAGSTINNALGGLPAVVGDILSQVGHLPNAFGLAAVAAMAFAPQITKAAASAVGLGAAIDKAVGSTATQKIAGLTAGVNQLNLELSATKTSFADLVSGSTLNQLNAQLRDAVTQSGAFHSSTAEAVTAAEQLVTVQREQTREQKAINDLIRQAQGLQRQDVRDAEVASRVAKIKSRELQQRKDAELQNQINAELAEYERLASEVAAQTKRWADNLDRIARSSRAGALGSTSQLRTRLDEFRQNRQSAEIARQRSAEALALEARQTGSSYPLSQLPAGRELLPGGNSMTASSQYRAMLNAQAQMRQAAATAVAQSERTILGFQAQTLRTERDITAAKLQQAAVDERSVAIARDRNKLLLEQYQAEQRVANGTLDRASRLADLRRRKALGEQRGKQAESLALGVGFPLLFGGGPGSVLGAAGGSFVGSGFGGQILGGALGQAADQFAQAVAKTGAALLRPVENFKELADAGLLASKSQEKYIQKLIDAGRQTEAAALIQSEIVKKIGVTGAQNLQNAGIASDRLNKAMAELNLQLQAAVAGPLAGLLSWVTSIVSIGNSVNRNANRQSDILNGLSGKDRQSLQAQEQRILSGANIFNEAQKRQQVSALYERYSSRATINTPTGSVDRDAVALAKGKTAELQAQVALASRQLALAGLTLEKDGGRYVNAAKAVALQEYDNKLLEIKNSWIGQAVTNEAKLAQLQAARLDYSAKLRGIDAQVAQRTDQNDTARLQAEKALYDQRAESINILVRMAEVMRGQEAGLLKQIELSTNLGQQKIAALQVEQETALKEAAKNGTLQETTKLYNERLQALQTTLYIESAISQEKLDQYRLEVSLADAAKKRQLESDLAGLVAPANRTPLEQLAIDQAQRRDSLLGPRFNQLDELQQRLLAAGAGTSDEAIQKLQKDIFQVNVEIDRLSGGLATIEGQEVVWTKNQTAVEALNSSINAVGTTVTSVFTGLIAGTDSWTSSLSNALNALSNVFLQAGLSALGGGDHRGLFSFLTGDIGKKNAMGNVFARNGVVPFAKGGVVSSPTIFPFAKGVGLMGEAGPEAVMPLTRAPNGQLGVVASGSSGSVNVVVNVDATGSKVEGDAPNANALGRVVSAAVQQELIRQKRPGGLLA